MTTTITRPGVEMLPSGDERGLDPRDMTPAELNAVGHESMPVLKAIRAHCVECSGGAANEARMCTAVQCHLWPFRMGANPWRAPASDAQREAARSNAARLRKIDGSSENCGRMPGENERTDQPATLVAANISRDSEAAPRAEIGRAA